VSLELVVVLTECPFPGTLIKREMCLDRGMSLSIHGVWSTLQLPLYGWDLEIDSSAIDLSSRQCSNCHKLTHVEVELFVLPLACLRCSKFIPITK
jgi:hypothetical protein